MELCKGSQGSQGVLVGAPEAQRERKEAWRLAKKQLETKRESMEDDRSVCTAWCIFFTLSLSLE
jgi:hypothetical protein